MHKHQQGEGKAPSQQTKRQRDQIKREAKRIAHASGDPYGDDIAYACLAAGIPAPQIPYILRNKRFPATAQEGR